MCDTLVAYVPYVATTHDVSWLNSKSQIDQDAIAKRYNEAREEFIHNISKLDDTSQLKIFDMAKSKKNALTNEVNKFMAQNKNKQLALVQLMTKPSLARTLANKVGCGDVGMNELSTVQTYNEYIKQNLQPRAGIQYTMAS